MQRVGSIRKTHSLLGERDIYFLPELWCKKAQKRARGVRGNQTTDRTMGSEHSETRVADAMCSTQNAALIFQNETHARALQVAAFHSKPAIPGVGSYLRQLLRQLLTPTWHLRLPQRRLRARRADVVISSRPIPLGARRRALAAHRCAAREVLLRGAAAGRRCRLMN